MENSCRSQMAEGFARMHGGGRVEDLEFDAVVSMGCGDACPHVPARRRLEWDLPDPADMPRDEFRRVRDEIDRRVRQLLAEI